MNRPHNLLQGVIYLPKQRCVVGVGGQTRNVVLQDITELRQVLQNLGLDEIPLCNLFSTHDTYIVPQLPAEVKCFLPA